MASEAGTFEVNNEHGIWDFYLDHDGLHAHGYPVGNEYATGVGTRQDFQTGYYTWDSIHGVVEH